MIAPDFVMMANESKAETGEDHYPVVFCEKVLTWLRGLKGEELAPYLSVSYSRSSNQYQIVISVDA